MAKGRLRRFKQRIRGWWEKEPEQQPWERSRAALEGSWCREMEERKRLAADLASRIINRKPFDIALIDAAGRRSAVFDKLREIGRADLISGLVKQVEEYRKSQEEKEQ